ncbi:hypothetical protein [Oscillatoria salina]
MTGDWGLGSKFNPEAKIWRSPLLRKFYFTNLGLNGDRTAGNSSIHKIAHLSITNFVSNSR